MPNRNSLPAAGPADVIDLLIAVVTTVEGMKELLEGLQPKIEEFPQISKHQYFCSMSQTIFHAGVELAQLGVAMQRMAQHPDCTERMLNRIRDILDAMLDADAASSPQHEPEVRAAQQPQDRRDD